MLVALVEMGNAGRRSTGPAPVAGHAVSEGTEATPLLAPSAAEGAATTSASSTPTFAEVAAAPRAEGSN